MKEISKCRVCGNDIELIFSLGDLYISDFPEKDEIGKSKKGPLVLVKCTNSECSLIQLKHTVEASSLFGEQYWYRSGTNSSMKKALKDITESIQDRIELDSGDAVLDIGCNDGTLLDSYTNKKLYKLGIDPARNMEKFSKIITDKTIVDFFSSNLINKDSELNQKEIKVITTIGMFYDLDEPNKFVSDIHDVLDDEGLWVIQMSHLTLMLDTNNFDNICHEHLEYYSLNSLNYLLEKNGFKIVDIEFNDVNGGSSRTYVQKMKSNSYFKGDRKKQNEAKYRVTNQKNIEDNMKLDSKEIYEDYVNRINRIGEELVCFIKYKINEGKKIAVYGASTKGNTLLQYYKIDHNMIFSAAERNPDKWGKVTVGTNIPIISEEEMRKRKPDYMLVLPWHFIDEFVERESEYLKQGGTFIQPLPNICIIK